MNMSLHDLMEQIESVSFEAEMSVFSGFNSFLSGLQRDKTVKRLLSETGKSPDNKEIVLSRLLALLQDSGDPNYAHPHDIALASYLYTLSETEPHLADEAVKGILVTGRLWWTKRLAEQIHEAELKREEAT